MAQASKPTSAEWFWLILGIVTVLILVITLCILLLGEGGNWFTPVGMLFTGTAAFSGFVFERRKRRRSEAQPTAGADPAAPR